jgi:DNA uptake protein ComE-like DNA-binding protein
MKVSTKWIAALAACASLSVPPAWVGAAETAKKAAAEAQKAPSKSGPLDINSASVDELKAIRGISEAQARKIVEGRPYKRKIELVNKKILSQDTFDQVKKQIVAKPASK